MNLQLLFKVSKITTNFLTCQEGLDTKMKGSNFAFDSIDLLYYKFHKISLNRGRSHIDSPEWIKNKKATINPKNKDNKCLKYAIAAALNHNEINNHPEKISKLKPFINNYNWKDIEFPSHKEDYKKFEQNSKTIALNILFVPYNTKKKLLNGITSNHNEWRLSLFKLFPFI